MKKYYFDAIHAAKCACGVGDELAYRFQRLATGWTVRSSDTVREEMFRTRPLRPWGPPSLLYNGYRVFPGDKAAEAWH